jgi:hypothetical protein
LRWSLETFVHFLFNIDIDVFDKYLLYVAEKFRMQGVQAIVLNGPTFRPKRWMFRPKYGKFNKIWPERSGRSGQTIGRSG